MASLATHLEVGAVPKVVRSAAVARAGLLVLALGLLYVGPDGLAWAGRLVRLIGAQAGWGGDWVSILRRSEPSAWLGTTWTLALGGLLIALGWPELLRAAMLTFVALAVVDAARIVVACVLGSGAAGLAWAAGAPPAWLALVGLAGRATLSVLLVRYLGRLRRNVRGERAARAVSDSRPPAIAGRMAILSALIFAGYIVGRQAWTVSEDLVPRWPSLVRWLATPPVPPGRRGPPTPEQRQARAALADLHMAAVRSGEGRYVEARSLYSRALVALQELADARPEHADWFRGERAQGLNNLAWLLATCPDPRARHAERAVFFARRALELAPEDGNTWNTLGVALYRAGALDEGRRAFARAMDLREGGTPHDWFFLALIAWREGRPVEARRWFDRAVAYRLERRPRDDELYRFHVEAAEALGQPPPDPPEDPGTPQGRPRPRGPFIVP
jgi:tetratricopeptide (TPR) repeat protein